MSMRTKTLISFFTIGIILFSLGCKNTSAQENFSEQEAEKTLKDFYKGWLTIHENFHKKNIPLNKHIAQIDSVKSRYCTPGHLKEFEKDDYLDYDPYIKSQMIDIRMLAGLTVQKDSVKNNLYYVTIKYREEQRTIKLLVVKEKETYKIGRVFKD